eukprot:Hpha_TRINITY_DN22811_c0_g1::TRINITY_DN22811_c0_g1_i1::g.84429::m.84429/K18776/MTR2, MT48; cap2 methyltransferase
MYADLEERAAVQPKQFSLRQGPPGKGAFRGKGAFGASRLPGKAPQPVPGFGFRDVTLGSVLAEAPVRQAASGKVVVADNAFQRRLLRSAPRTPYRRRTGELKTTMDWRSRRLFLLETEFLTQYGELGKTVIYDGAAPGQHLPLLCRFFPEHNFVLLDKAKNRIRCPDMRKLKIVGAPLTKETAEEFKEKYGESGILYISNLKGDADSSWTEKEMAAQREFYETLQPKKALLRFRLPYEAGETEYLDGTLLFCPYGSQTSTELRLIPKADSPLRVYNHQTVEEQMFHFNIFTRVHTFPEYSPAHASHTRHKAPVAACGFDWRYDNTAESAILWAFAEKFGDRYYREKEARETAAKERRARLAADAEKRNQERNSRRAERGQPEALKQAVKRKRSPEADDFDDEAPVVAGVVTPDLIRRLSEEISKELSAAEGRRDETLATRPLNFLQQRRQPASTESTPAAKTGDAQEEDAVPVAKRRRTDADADPADALLSGLGVDLSDSEEEEEGGGGAEGDGNGSSAAAGDGGFQRYVASSAVNDYVMAVERKKREREEERRGRDGRFDLRGRSRSRSRSSSADRPSPARKHRRKEEGADSRFGRNPDED